MSDTPKTKKNAKLVREMARSTIMVSLSSLSHQNGHPFISTLAMATDSSARPIFLGSKLAQHTQNFLNDPRASILVQQTEPFSTNQDFPRASLMGKIVPVVEEEAQERYLRRYPDARDYLSFGDFEFYGLDIETIYLVGGFARIGHIPIDAYLCAPSLAECEADALQHMNEDHKSALKRYGMTYLDKKSEDWSLVGIDIEGFDMALEKEIYRINFPQTVTNSAQLRKIFTDM